MGPSLPREDLKVSAALLFALDGLEQVSLYNLSMHLDDLDTRIISAFMEDPQIGVLHEGADDASVQVVQVHGQIVERYLFEAIEREQERRGNLEVFTWQARPHDAAIRVVRRPSGPQPASLLGWRGLVQPRHAEGLADGAGLHHRYAVWRRTGRGASARPRFARGPRCSHCARRVRAGSAVAAGWTDAGIRAAAWLAVTSTDDPRRRGAVRLVEACPRPDHRQHHRLDRGSAVDLCPDETGDQRPPGLLPANRQRCAGRELDDADATRRPIGPDHADRPDHAGP